MNHEKCKKIINDVINRNQDEEYFLYPKIKNFTEDEQNIIVGSITLTEYDYFDEEEIDEKENISILKLLRVENLKHIAKRIKGINNRTNGSFKYHYFWYHLHQIIDEECPAFIVNPEDVNFKEDNRYKVNGSWD